MDNSCANEIPGAAEIVSWFGSIPEFHDAYLADIAVRIDGTGLLTIRAFRTTDKIDAKGYFVLDCHCTVTITLESIEAIDLKDFAPGEAILFSLKINKDTDGFNVLIESSYGVNGTIRAHGIRFEVQPA